MLYGYFIRGYESGYMKPWVFSAISVFSSLGPSFCYLLIILLVLLLLLLLLLLLWTTENNSLRFPINSEADTSEYLLSQRNVSPVSV